jgi:pseudouridine-5'-phosphate glycosidase
MNVPAWVTISEEVRTALQNRRPVVALESTLIAHGLPTPANIETAEEAEQAIRERNATPATIAIIAGRPTIGLSREELHLLAKTDGVMKASRRDLAVAVAERRTAATTVAATMFLAHQAGISVFATGGIGGAHPAQQPLFDISADLFEFTRTPVFVVCAGAKSILDLPQTLELLDSLGVPVLGYQTSEFPAFYVRRSGLSVSARVDSAAHAAAIFQAHTRMNGSGALLTLPVSPNVALASEEIEAAVATAEAEAKEQAIGGGALTPFLLKRLAELTNNRTLTANRALIVANARLAAEVAGYLV